MDLYYDLGLNRLVRSLNDRGEVLTLTFRLDQTSDIRMRFIRANEVVALAEPAIGKFGLKEPGAYDDDFVVAQLPGVPEGTPESGWTKVVAGSDVYYKFAPQFTTDELYTLIGRDGTTGNDKPSVTLMGDIKWSEAGADGRTAVFTAIVTNIVIRDDEGLPPNPNPPWGVPAEYLKKAGNLAGLADVAEARENLGVAAALPSWNANFVAEGDSRTADAVSWFTVLENRPAFAGKGEFHMAAFPGENLSVITDQFDDQVYPYRFAVTGKVLYVFVFIGTNDIALWGEDYVDDLKAYWALCKDIGAHLTVATIPPRGDNLTKEVERTLVNRRIRQASDCWDAMVDVDAMFPNAFDETFYKVDRIHATDFANEKIADCVNAIFSAGGSSNGQMALGDRPAGISEVVRNSGTKEVAGFTYFLAQIFANTAIQVGTGFQTLVAYALSSLFRIQINNNSTAWFIDHTGTVDSNSLSIKGKDGVKGLRVDWDTGDLLTTGGYVLPGGVKILSGTGSPEGVVTAPPSSQFYRTDGASGTLRYEKESGTGNTGWVAK